MFASSAVTKPGCTLGEDIQALAERPSASWLITPQNLARRRLLFQGFGEIAVAILQFLKQPHILDGDHRLVCEGFQKRNLLIGKRTDFSPPDIKYVPIAIPFRSIGTLR